MREPIPLHAPSDEELTEDYLDGLILERNELAAENERLAQDVTLATLRGVAIGVIGSMLSSAVLIWVGVWLLR